MFGVQCASVFNAIGGYMRIDRTRDERAKRLRARKLAAGMASRTVYLPTDTLESLRQAFAGPLGGVAWEDVAAAALARHERLAADAERQRSKRAAGLLSDSTTNERSRRYREANRDAVNQRQRERRAREKAAGQPAPEGGA